MLNYKMKLFPIYSMPFQDILITTIDIFVNRLPGRKVEAHLVLPLAT